MRLRRIDSCDVLVVGAGIAGVMAALSAAEHGCDVVLCSGARTFSGSSFYPGTWGLGLIGPEDDADGEDLVRTILDVGCGMADEHMVRAFVAGIPDAIGRLESFGVPLRRAHEAGEREFVPCFDHKRRTWRGLEADGARTALGARLDRLGVRRLEGCELLDLLRDGEGMGGAVVRGGDTIGFVACGSLVLATGGYGGLFRDRLTSDDVGGLGQSLALRQGCELVNMEFMQMMPALLSPCRGVVFNERTFRFARITDGQGRDLLPATDATRDLLDLRSTYGPFTSRLASREVDLALVRAQAASPEGATVRYDDELGRSMPEFIRTYFDWLGRTHHITPADSLHVGLFAHAANGGVRIGPDTSTGVDGLFACGEVTGGMHGADRIGGLSSANGLVFGHVAGESAAECAAGRAGVRAREARWDAEAFAGASELRAELRRTMTRHAMVLRDEAGLRAALDEVGRLESTCREARCGDASDLPASDVADSQLLRGQLTLAHGILGAELLRAESRGSHYREDYPEPDPVLARPILVRMVDGVVTARFAGV